MSNNIANLEARADALEIKLDRVLAALEGRQSAKTVTRTRKATTGNTVSKRDANGRFLPAKGKKATTKRAKATRKATKVTSGGTKWDGTRNDRSRWNDAVSMGTKLAGKNAEGVTYYSLIVQDETVWAEVVKCRKAGMTPNEVLAALI